MHTYIVYPRLLKPPQASIRRYKPVGLCNSVIQMSHRQALVVCLALPLHSLLALGGTKKRACRDERLARVRQRASPPLSNRWIVSVLNVDWIKADTA